MQKRDENVSKADYSVHSYQASSGRGGLAIAAGSLDIKNFETAGHQTFSYYQAPAAASQGPTHQVSIQASSGHGSLSIAAGKLNIGSISTGGPGIHHVVAPAAVGHVQAPAPVQQVSNQAPTAIAPTPENNKGLKKATREYLEQLNEGWSEDWRIKFAQLKLTEEEQKVLTKFRDSYTNEIMNRPVLLGGNRYDYSTIESFNGYDPVQEREFSLQEVEPVNDSALIEWKYCELHNKKQTQKKVEEARAAQATPAIASGGPTTSQYGAEQQSTAHPVTGDATTSDEALANPATLTPALAAPSQLAPKAVFFQSQASASQPTPQAQRPQTGNYTL